VAALALNGAQASGLLCSSYCRLYNDRSVCNKTLCLDGDLFSQFTGGRDNDGADVVSSGSVASASGVASGALTERRVGLENVL
jgi:hypothetical protein